MERIELQRTGKRPLAFTGKLLFEDSTSPNRASSRYSGATGHWSELRVYETDKGKYVVYLIRYTAWQGERDTYEAEVLDTPEAVISWVEANAPRWAGEVAEVLGVAEEV
ncbi:MAG: hypothetical protein ABDH20_13175 [Thermus sp.]